MAKIWQRKWFRGVTLVIVVVIVLLFGIDVWIDEPVRRSVERRVNAALGSYEVAIARADLSPWSLSLELFDTRVDQQKNPDPPVLELDRLEFSVAWRALFSGRLIADLVLERPRLHVDLPKLRAERDDGTPIAEQGWQQAVQEMYPLEIQHLAIRDGSVTYVDTDPERPLELHGLVGEAANIRNVHSPENAYPATFWLRTGVFDDGFAEIRGKADFLGEPVPKIAADLTVEDVPLDALGPVVDDYRLTVTGGILSLDGRLETSGAGTRAVAETVRISKLRVDYGNDPDLTRRAVEAVNRASERPELELVVERLSIEDSDLGFVDRSREPDYRLFVSGFDATLKNWTNRPVEEGEGARFEATGAFMGNGDTRVDGRFRPDDGGADFDLTVAIRGTRLASLNDMLRAWSNVDASGGVFSFYGELEAEDGSLDGYVKPLFQNVDVYDPQDDAGQNVFHKLWEGLVEEVGELLENDRRDEVVTVADLSGALEDPDASNLQIVLNLIRNAFFDAILPGFRDHAGLEQQERGPEAA